MLGTALCWLWRRQRAAINVLSGAGRSFTKTGKGAVVCKLPAKDQDLRNDIPTVGLETLEVMRASSCNVLAFDAKCTFVVEPKGFLENAKKYGISYLSNRF